MRDFLLGDEIHSGGDRGCPMCVEEYPKACACGGLIHAAEQVDEGTDITIATRCDLCGRSEDDLAGEVA